MVAAAMLPPTCMPPAIIQSYRLETPVAEGGFGRVWRAVHQPTGRTVAVKVLHDASGDSRMLRQAGRIAEAMAEVDALDASGDAFTWVDQGLILQLERALTMLVEDPVGARRAARRLARDASAQGRGTLLARARHAEAMALHAVGRTGDALTRLGEAIRIARSQQLPELPDYVSLRDTWTPS